MSDEIKAAAERYRAHQQCRDLLRPHPDCPYRGAKFDVATDREALADAYLAAAEAA